MKKIILFLLVALLFVSCDSGSGSSSSADVPKFLPVFDTPSSAGESSRAIVYKTDVSTENLTYLFAPAIRSFKANTEEKKVGEPYTVTWGSEEITFSISKKDGKFVFTSSEGDDYNFLLEFDDVSNTFNYSHKINGDQTTNLTDVTDFIFMADIPDTKINDNGTFSAMASAAGYFLGKEDEVSFSPPPGTFYLYDKIEVYYGDIKAVSAGEINTPAGIGCGIAYHTAYSRAADRSYELTLSDTASGPLTVLQNYINTPSSFKTGEYSNFTQATIAVVLDENKGSFFETDGDWDERTHNLWTSQGPVFADFKELIPWTTTLTE